MIFNSRTESRVGYAIFARGSRGDVVVHTVRRRRCVLFARRRREHAPSGRDGPGRYASRRRLFADNGGYRKDLFPSVSRVPILCPGQIPLLPFAYNLSPLFLHAIVTLDGFGLDDDSGISPLEVLAGGGYGASDVATLQPERNSQTRQHCRHGRCNDFVDFRFVHTDLNFDYKFLGSPATASEGSR